MVQHHIHRQALFQLRLEAAKFLRVMVAAFDFGCGEAD